MELNVKYREQLKEYCVEENGFSYYMPQYLVQLLQTHCEDLPEASATPIEDWYVSLSEVERRAISRISSDEEKRSSLW